VRLCVNNSLDGRLGWPRIPYECVVEDTRPLSCRQSNPGQVLIWSQFLNGQTISPSQQSGADTGTFRNTILHPWKPNFTNYRDLRSFGMLCSVGLFLVADNSGPPIGPIFKGPALEIRTEVFDTKHVHGTTSFYGRVEIKQT